MEVLTKYDYSKTISLKKIVGKIDEAIYTAMQAKEKYPDENIFEKFLGDLYFEKGNYELAGDAYIQFLEKIGDNTQYIKHFARFIHRYLDTVDNKMANEYICKVEESLDRANFNKVVISNVCEILSKYIEYPQMEFFKDDHNFKKAVEYIHEIENTYQLYIFCYKFLILEHSEKNKNISKHVVSVMEKQEQYTAALQLIIDVLKYDDDQVAIRTLFRICRKVDDYSVAEQYILEHPEIKKVEKFNVLYELVFYYSKMGETEERNDTLIKIEKCGSKSIPIMRTLYNFYLQFGMIDKAAETMSKINVLEDSVEKERTRVSDRKQQEDDAALALFGVIKDMFEELEHSRKLISMSELLKGFSHELGQPVTNIRYSVQLYQMKLEKGVGSESELQELFSDILSQTSRIKRLLSRFSPVVKEKDDIAEFSVIKEITDVFNEFNSRLNKEKIEWEIRSNIDFMLYGDNIKFDQIFYNLIGNSIYAINKRGGKGKILVNIFEKEDAYIIHFEDNGTGISPQYLDKIFEPFFTTKDHDHSSNENGGGEGLGLYIIWNIVRIFDGNIKVDKQFEHGARFIIEIFKKERKQK